MRFFKLNALRKPFIAFTRVRVAKTNLASTAAVAARNPLIHRQREERLHSLIATSRLYKPTLSPYHQLKKLLSVFDYDMTNKKKYAARLPHYLQAAVFLRKKTKEQSDDQVINAINIIKIYENINDASLVFSSEKMRLSAKLAELDSFVGPHNTILVPENNTGTEINIETMIELTPQHIKNLLLLLPARYESNDLYKALLKIDGEIKTANAKLNAVGVGLVPARP